MNDGKNAAKELLLSELKSLNESLWKNEETGEKRVQFFITLVTAVMAGLGTVFTAFGTADSMARTLPVFIFALAALFALGAVTFFRILKRNQYTDECKFELDAVRDRYRDYFDNDGILTGHTPFQRPARRPGGGRSFGGLVHLTAVMNAAILSALPLAIGLPAKAPLPAAASAVLAFAISLVLQSAYAAKRESASRRRLEESSLTHAGGVVFRPGKSGPEFLLITARKAPRHWIFPRGHIEEGERIEQTAVREVREETGFEAEILSPLGAFQYFTPEERVKIRFYLMKKTGGDENYSKEGRHLRWCAFEKAIDLLSFADYRKQLQAARRQLERTAEKTRPAPRPKANQVFPARAPRV